MTARAQNRTRSIASFTRPANTTTYNAKDALADSTSAPTVVMTFAAVARSFFNSGQIVKAQLLTDQTSNTETFRLHLFNVAPVAINDHAQCTAPLYASAAGYLGAINFPAAQTEGTGVTAAYSTASWNTSGAGLPLSFQTASGDDGLYGILETPNGFTPNSGQKFTVILESQVD